MSNGINNTANYSIGYGTGSVPDVSGALHDYYQPMTFIPLVKTVTGFEVEELGSPVSYPAVIQPLTERKLALKPEGQRAWTWYQVFSDSSLPLDVDDVILWNGVQTRIMALKDAQLYGYYEYHLVQDWTGSGP